MNDPGPLILLVEDDPPLRRYLRTTLAAHGYRTEEAKDGAAGLHLAAAARPEAMLLDLGLPDMDGLQVLDRLRGWSSMPVIVISARGQESDKIRALDQGADDYLTKPFSTGELLARMRAVLRRSAGEGGEEGSKVAWGGVELDLAAHTVRRHGLEVHLTPNEFGLLAALARHAGKVLTHRQLLREVYPGTPSAQTSYLRVYLAQLRHKLEDQPARPRHLLTEPGVGYRLRID